MRAGPVFTKGDTMGVFVKTAPSKKVAEPKKPRGASASGMPGYITTSTDRSSGHMKKGRGSTNAVNGPKSIPSKKGPDRSKIMSAESAGGSMDRSYRATSTGPAGKIHSMAQGPKAPRSRGMTSNSDGKRAISGGLGFKNPAAPRMHGTTRRGTLGGKGTMEALVGKTPTGNISGRKKSMFY